MLSLIVFTLLGLGGLMNAIVFVLEGAVESSCKVVHPRINHVVAACGNVMIDLD
jgi:hypothetical protein